MVHCVILLIKKSQKLLVGKDNVEAGLHEGIQLMHVGDQMRFILPSHLAHGLTGDQSKIPRSPVSFTKLNYWS